ncbi:hypothetical protein [Nocardioides convexus]|uniref:hypothetical protein n=1 Tax=Nocardioides convexus TaxID=2712224 RepID=UPI0024187421|nr:hypothetical protein [Nocardioides convexus]
MDRAAGLFAATRLLARPDRLHLEHHHGRGPAGCGRPARRHPRAGGPARLPAHRARCDRRWRDDRLVRVRDLRRARARPGPPGRGGRPEGVDLPHHAARAHGPRGAARRTAPGGCRARCDQGAGDLGRAPRRRGRRARRHHPALRPRRGRRAGRDRPRCAAAPSSAYRRW